MLKNKKATVLIYVLILTSIVMFISLIIFNNAVKLNNSINYEIIQNKINSKLQENAEFEKNYYKYLTSDSLGFVDNMSCPDNVTMSGDTLYQTGITLNRFKNSNGQHVCSGSYNFETLNVMVNSSFTSFDSASWNGENISLEDNGFGTLSGTFSYDNTNITIPADSYQKPDYIEDNFSSDNDVYAKLYSFGIISNTGSYENVFWNTTKTSDFIEEIPNTDNDEYVKIGKITNGVLYLSTDETMSIKIVKFDKSRYDSDKTLYPLSSQESTSSVSSGSGYLQNNGTISINKTGNEYTFDFKNYDYAVFLKNLGTSSLSYKIHIENSDGKMAYIVPLDDSSANELKLLEGYIYIDSGTYIGKVLEFTKQK